MFSIGFFFGTIVVPPFTIIIVVAFDFDMGYFINNQIWQDLTGQLVEQESFLIRLTFQIIRQVFTVFGLELLVNLLSLCIFLDMCRIDMYDFCMTILLTKGKRLNMGFSDSWFRLNRIYTELYLCHSILADFFQYFYFYYMIYSQVAMVGFLWVCITQFKTIPLILWSGIFMSALDLGFGAFYYMDMSCCAHELSHVYLEGCGRMIRENNNKGAYCKLVWRSVRPLRIRCGSFFEIDKQRLFYSFQLAMNNLANLCLLWLHWTR